MREGSEIVPNEFIEFGNSLERKPFLGGRNGEKDVLLSLALMGEMILNQCMAKRRKNESTNYLQKGSSESEWGE